MKLKTRVRAGGIWENHNETIVGQAKGVAVRTNVKAGGIRLANHNETVVGQPKKGLRVRTNVKAGGFENQHNETIVGKPRGAR